MKKCKIYIKDEITCKLEGLQARDKSYLYRMFEYEIPGAKYLPAVRIGKWNGKVSYFTLGGSTYINLLPEIVEYLEKQDYEIELFDSRDYQKQFNFKQVTSDTFAHINWPDKHPQAGTPIILRDYQVNIVNQFLSNPQSIQVAATGSGKTIICAALSHTIESYGNTIIIVPNTSLVAQTEEDYINVGLDVGVYFGLRKEIGHKHTICTWQSINWLVKNQHHDVIEKIMDNVVCVICDEVHSVKADVLKTMLSTVMSKVPLRYGLTGTIPKHKYESTALEVCIGPVISKLQASDLQDKGVLANCHVNIIQLQDHAEFSNYQSELKYLLENKDRLKAMVSLVDRIKESGNTLVLVDRVNAGEELSKMIKDSVFIKGKTRLSERKEEYQEVATSENKVIVATYGVAAVGINIPRIFNLVLIESGKSFIRVIQSIGRGLRKAEDKDFVQIWDITSSCKFSKRHLTQRKEYYRESNYPFSLEKIQYK